MTVTPKDRADCCDISILIDLRKSIGRTQRRRFQAYLLRSVRAGGKPNDHSIGEWFRRFSEQVAA